MKGLAHWYQRGSAGKKATFILSFALATSLVFFFFSISLAHAQGGGLENPVRFGTIPEFIAGALEAMVMISLPILTFFIVYSGFLFVSARGNASKLETARNNFVYVIIGAVLILGAWVLATLISGTVKQLTDPAPRASVDGLSEICQYNPDACNT